MVSALQRKSEPDGQPGIVSPSSAGRWDNVDVDLVTGAWRVAGYCAGPHEKAWPVDAPTHDYADANEYEQARASTVSHAEKYHSDGHATRVEALACWAQYQVDFPSDPRKHR